MAPQRIAVLGAGGFLGSHLVPALLARLDCQIDAVDVTFQKLAPTDGRVRRIDAPLARGGLIEEIAARNPVVISLTALCNPALYTTRPLEVIDASYTDLVPLVSRCAAGGNRLIHFSTCEVYGREALDEAARPMPEMNEDHSGFFLGPLHRERWTYACAKQLLERVIWAHGQHGSLDFTIIRPFNVIGPRMDFVPGVDGEGVPRVLASFMNALLRGQPLPLVDGGGQRRSFISVHDFVEAIVRVVELPAACRGQVINVGNPGNDVTIRKLAQQLAQVFAERVPGQPLATLENVTADHFYGPGYDDSAQRIPDITKARKLLGWNPRIYLADMLPEIIDDYVTRYGLSPGEGAPVAAAATGQRLR